MSHLAAQGLRFRGNYQFTMAAQAQTLSASEYEEARERTLRGWLEVAKESQQIAAARSLAIRQWLGIEPYPDA